MRTPLLLTVLLLVLPASALGMSAAEVFAKASPSIVVVETFDKKGKAAGQGSGVVVGPGLVVTNCHVLKTADTVQVVYAKRRIAASIRDIDVDRDLCSLDARGLVAPTAAIGTSRLRIGESVFTIGAPQGLALTLGQGILSSRRGEGEFQLLQITAPISPGSSGGGLFDDSGRLIGITTLFHKDGQALNFAVPVEWIAEMPARWQAEVDEFTAKSSPDGEVERAADDAAAAANAAAEAADAAAAAAAGEAAAEGVAAAEADTRWHTVLDGEWLREVDSKTVDVTGMKVKAWFKDSYPKPRTFDDIKNVAYSLSQIEFDCSNRKLRTLEYGLYDGDLRSLWNYSEPYNQWKPVVPESYGETTWILMCKVRAELADG